MFEALNVEAFRFNPSELNFLVSHGRQTGIVVDVGETSAFSAAFYEGMPVPSGMCKVSDMAGRRASSELRNTLADRFNVYLTRSYDRELIVTDIKR